MLYVCSIEFQDGIQLKVHSVYWYDIEQFMHKWMDRPWFKITIAQREALA